MGYRLSLMVYFSGNLGNPPISDNQSPIGNFPMPAFVHPGITVAHFLETYREKLRLELLTGAAGLPRLKIGRAHV